MYKMDPIIEKRDMVFFTFFLVADFLECFFFVTVAVTKVGQSLLASLIILYQLKFRTDDKLLLSLSMDFENDEISCLIMSHITWTDDFVTLLALNSFRKPLRYLDSLNNCTPIPTAVSLTCNVI